MGRHAFIAKGRALRRGVPHDPQTTFLGVAGNQTMSGIQRSIRVQPVRNRSRGSVLADAPHPAPAVARQPAVSLGGVDANQIGQIDGMQPPVAVATRASADGGQQGRDGSDRGEKPPANHQRRT